MTPSNAAPAAGAPDPSMEDILASIRRILSEDEAEPAAAEPAPEHQASPPHGSDVLALDASMLVEDTNQSMPAPQELPALHAQEAPAPAPSYPAPAAPAYTPQAAEENDPWPNLPPLRPPEALLAPEASAAAVSSMNSLLRTLIAERQHVALHRSGSPSIEDVVREELRPLLKQWLDANLPALVERLVRTEIERVVGRALS